MSLVHLTHIQLNWGGHFFEENLYQTLEAFVHLFLGVVTGFLSEKFIQTSEKLKQSYKELQEKTLLALNAEEQLKRTERIQALAELSAGVAHEIRTPLSSILGAAEILSNQNLNTEQRKEFTGILLRETHHLNRVVNEFLNFAQPKKNHREECNIPDIIDSVLELTFQQRKIRNIKIHKNFELNLPPISFDSDQLKQVFVNLISNAILSMPVGGHLTFTALKTDTRVICTVEDTGPGIAADIMDRIFDPFFTTRKNGTGLGLSIVQKIVSHHQSSIEVENRTTGGACFKLTFPLDNKRPHERSNNFIG